MPTSHINNKRIAKNTALLYVRTLIVMLITLYTSRVILKTLGVEDYGVYQVVGGMVAMFSVISNSLSQAISRYITYELGRGDREHLMLIFTTSVIIQLVISAIVFVIAEVVGVWFMETHMQIPEGRMTAAYWVLHCTLISFVFSLMSVPYNACIIAHEHMKTFAYVSLIDALMKLGIIYLIAISPVDRLVAYSVLMAVLSVVIRIIYARYCHKHFDETRGKMIFDKKIFKEMLGFAGWNFLSGSPGIINNQGVNMLVNVYFGVTVNAARGIATQVEGAVMKFVRDFTVAVNPQITKSYATGDFTGMYRLVCRGAKFAYFLMLLMSLPLILEADTILHLWLTEVPEHAVSLARLSLILGLFDSIASSSYTGCIATGKIKKYAMIITPIAILEFPLAWIAFKMGGAVETSYYTYIVVKFGLLLARAYLLNDLVGLPVSMFVKSTLLPVFLTTIISVIPMVLIVNLVASGYVRLAISLIVGLSMTGLTILYVGMTSGERNTAFKKLTMIINQKYRK